MVEMMIGMLSESLSMSAEWRREKAEEFPHDANRNLEAAAELDRLAAEALKAVGSSLDRRFSQAFERVEEDCLCWTEQESQLIREVGFHWSGDINDFINTLISRCCDQLEVREVAQ
ncbi:hypothetical protein [Bradyrhizobium sp. UFLA03-84]|uniref:hypothetical protein n=1 Tax=Bradyrhizobium sp. UFLA03-84 TaxID=418599 RepID=UPI001177D092|nr:hypothetical protein [Bradyrhizobium sp. UFLA03-84]